MSLISDNEEMFRDSISRYNENSNEVSSDAESQTSESEGNTDESEYSTENQSSSDSNRIDSPIVLKKKLTKRRIVSSDEESDAGKQISKNTSNNSNSSKLSTNASMESSSNISKSESKSPTNKSSISIVSTNTSANISNNTSTNLKSFVDENLFADDIQNSKHSTISERFGTEKSLRSSTSRSMGKRFSKHRSQIVTSCSSDEDDSNNMASTSRNSISNKSVRKSSVLHMSNNSAVGKPNHQEQSHVSDEEIFEQEFQRNIYSPRTRMSITGLRRSTDISNSEEELVDSRSPPAEAVSQSIVIPDSDDEDCQEINDSSMIILDNDEPSNSKNSLKPFRKSPLQTSSPKLKPNQKPMLVQQKINTQAKVYVSQEFFDKQVMKLIVITIIFVG